ncbi:MAG: hypothetical protein QOE70_4376 [Chthoniobacter sp.]|nr:hypothetical protein [Chthoniobacter sp.]
MTERYVTTAGTDTYANSTNSATPMSLATAFTNAAAGDRINVKAGTYTLSASLTQTNAATATTQPIWWRGYSATIGDLDTLGRTVSGTGPIDTTGFPTLDCGASFTITTAGFTIFERFIVTANRNGVALAGGISAAIRWVSCTNLNTGGSTRAISTNSTSGILTDSDCTSGGGAGCGNLSGGWRYLRNRFKGGTGAGATGSATSASYWVDNLFFGSAVGLDFTDNRSAGTALIYSNTFQGCSTAAIRLPANATNLNGFASIDSNHITDCGYAINNQNSATQADLVVRNNNRTRDNTNGDAGLGDSPNWLEITTDTGGSATDYTATGSDDYRLITGAAGRGTAAVKNRDVGATQHQDAGAVKFQPGMNGGINN